MFPFGSDWPGTINHWKVSGMRASTVSSAFSRFVSACFVWNWPKIQRHSFIPDRIPGNELPDRLVQFLEPGGIRAEKDQGVPIVPGAGATAIKDVGGLLPCRAVGILRRVRVLRPQDHQPGLAVVGNVAAGHAGMDFGKIASGTRPPCAIVGRSRPQRRHSLSCPARSSASRDTVGCVEYQYRFPST